MTVSDSLPIQFWPVAEETFNEKAVCGIIKQDCFCQPFNCDDEIVIQVQNTNPVSLLIANSDNEVIDEVPLTEVVSGVWEATIFDEASPVTCEKVALTLGEYSNFLVNTTFASALAPWVNESRPSGTLAWTQSTNLAIFQKVGAGYAESDYLVQTFSGRSAGYYKLVVNTRKSSSTPNISIYYQIFSGPTLIMTCLAYVETNTSNVEHQASFYVPSAFDRIQIFGTTDNTGSFGIEDINLYELTSSYKSDCIDLKTSHDCTELVEYSNSTDFDGLVYAPNNSPPPTFKLRIPAVFFEEKNPQEQEDLELSNGVIVTLRSSIQQKTLLETGYMPNYMHLKLQKVLMHETITIDSQGWKKRDSYDDNPIKKYNLKRASVLLTKYNSVEKNTI